MWRDYAQRPELGMNRSVRHSCTEINLLIYFPPVRADQLPEDSLAAATWHRILNAIERLQAKAPAEGEKVHYVGARGTRCPQSRLVGADWIRTTDLCHVREAALYR